ncbi:DUF4375 domain-containing protein [bacterium]|nr:DUF4375 domain-containing protein [bacterium]
MRQRGIAPYLIAAFVALLGVVACCGPWALVGHIASEWSSTGPLGLNATAFESWGDEGELSPEKIREGMDLIVAEDPKGWMASMRLAGADPKIVAPMALGELKKQLAANSRNTDLLRTLSRLVAMDASDEAASVLLEYAKAIRLQADNNIFDYALMTTGRRDAVEFILDRMGKRKDASFWTIQSGLQKAQKDGRAQPETITLVAERMAALHLVTAKEDAEAVVNTGASRLWLAVDPAAATNRLTLPPFWAADFAELRTITMALRDSETPPDPERLRALGRELWKLPADADNRYSIPDVVWMLAWQKAPETPRLTEALAADSNKYIASQAVNIRAAYAGIKDAYAFASAIIEKAEDKSAVPAPYRDLVAVEDIFYAFEDDGFSYYFATEESDDWEEDLARLHQFGFTKEANALERAVSLFGSAKPAATAEEREAQLEKLSDKDKELLNSLAEPFWESTYHDVLTEFAIKNAELFNERDRKD